MFFFFIFLKKTLPNLKLSTTVGFRDKAISKLFLSFFVTKKIYKLKKPNLKFSNLYWGAVRIHSENANLSSKYDFSNLKGFRDMPIFIISFRSKNFD